MSGHDFPEFALPRYMKKHHSVKKNISHSDCEALTMAELLKYADDESRQLWDTLSLAYTEFEGHPLLKEEIAKLYKTITVADINVVIVHEGVMLASKALADQAKSELGEDVKPEAICMFPGFQSLSIEPKAFGCDVKIWKGDFTPERGWYFDVTKLEGLVTERTRILVVNLPHNPTGWCATEQELQQIVDFATRHNLYIFSDEVYSMLPRHDGAPRIPSLSDIYDKAIILNGLSKTMGCPGLRVGWLVTRDQTLFNRIAILKDYSSICSSAPSEILALIALRAREEILARNAQLLKDNMESADQLFTKEFPELFLWHKPDGGTHTCIKMTDQLLAKYPTASDLAAALRDQEGLLIAPGAVAGADDDCFRLGMGHIKFKINLEAFRQFLKKHVV